MQSVSINERIEKIKGNEKEINRFIDEYKPFIASYTREITGRFVRYGEDDELSISLIAFDEAVKSYSSKQGSFLPFARKVIRRRLIDYYRKEKRHKMVVPISDYISGDDREIDLSVEESLDRYSIDRISEYRRMELEDLKQELKGWDISFFDLIEVSPKHEKSRKVSSKIIRYLLSKPDYIEKIKTGRRLPIAEIQKDLDIPRKKIERIRKYIIAVIIISTGDYMYIKDYIKELSN